MNKDALYSVYMHISPSGKVYVGISSDINRRWGYNGIHYVQKQKNGEYMHKPFALAILKYGWDNFKHIVLLENRPVSEAMYAERYLIRWYKIHKLSYNITDGGEGALGCSHPISEERRKAVTEFMRAHHPMKGKHHSVESRKKMSESLKGRKLSKEQRMHISESLKGKKKSKEHARKIRDYMIKHPERCPSGNQKLEVHQYSLDGNYITSFPSAYDASISISGKNNAGCIRSNIYGESTSAIGYLWSYEKKEKIAVPNKSKKRGVNTKKGVNQYSKEGKYIDTYSSIAEASKRTGIPDRNISRCCDPDIRLFTAGNYLWEYDKVFNRTDKIIA